MTIEVKVPALPESVADATVATWHKKPGDKVTRDENILDLETDKVMLEVPAPADGILGEILANEGDTVSTGDLLAKIKKADNDTTTSDEKPTQSSAKDEAKHDTSSAEDATSPSVRRMMSEHGIAPSDIKSQSASGRITKDDVTAFLERQDKKTDQGSKQSDTAGNYSEVAHAREEKRVPMSRLRAKIAERLVSAQHNAAMLTTFNEVNLDAVMNLRKEYKTLFEEKHGVKLGFMSFFTKAVVEALKRFPAVNASIDGNDVIYHGYYDIGIAVSTERGLVVPVIRDACQKSMAQLEKSINDYAGRARAGKLSIDEMQGGSFTITNGGVFGSLLATPIINPPQTAILGMHKIEQRPIAENGQVVIRPMMYLALSYDHRLIDGKESVQFLVNVKELLEDPTRLLLNV